MFNGQLTAINGGKSALIGAPHTYGVLMAI